MSSTTKKSNLRCCYRFLELFNSHKTFSPRLIPKVTNTAPQIQEAIVGTSTTPSTNSRIVRPLGDTCYKYSNERCPCNEPCPVKQSPASEPTIVTIRINLKCSWNKITDILTHTIYKCFKVSTFGPTIKHTAKSPIAT